MSQAGGLRSLPTSALSAMGSVEGDAALSRNHLSHYAPPPGALP